MINCLYKNGIRCPDNLYWQNGKRKKHRENLRINQLAVPRIVTRPYCRPVVDLSKRPIELVRPPCISTRLEQLALPPIRLLVSAYDMYRSTMDPKRLNKFNYHLQKSMLSMYSRLANAKLPEIKVPVRKWTEEEWAEHMGYMSKLASPRRDFSIDAPNMNASLNEETASQLAAMNSGDGQDGDGDGDANQRHILCRNATPPPKFINPHPVPAKYKHLTSHGIEKLSIPKPVREKKPKVMKISRYALRYKPTRRVKKLARPRTVVGKGPKETPNFSVRPAALKQLNQEKETFFTDLSLPKVRCLLESRNASTKPQQVEKFNRLIDESLRTPYSRLAKTKVPPKKGKLKRIQNELDLTTDPKYPEEEVTRTLPSEKTIALAVPPKRYLQKAIVEPPMKPYKNPYKCPNEYRHIQSVGIDELAKPKALFNVEVERQEWVENKYSSQAYLPQNPRAVQLDRHKALQSSQRTMSAASQSSSKRRLIRRAQSTIQPNTDSDGFFNFCVPDSTPSNQSRMYTKAKSRSKLMAPISTEPKKRASSKYPHIKSVGIEKLARPRSPPIHDPYNSYEPYKPLYKLAPEYQNIESVGIDNLSRPRSPVIEDFNGANESPKMEYKCPPQYQTIQTVGIEQLARPRTFDETKATAEVEPLRPKTYKTPAQYQNITTVGIDKLASPRQLVVPLDSTINDVKPFVSPYKAPPEYQSIQTVGLGKLAEPKMHMIRKKYVKAEDDGPQIDVSPRALQYKPTERVRSLAMPRKKGVADEPVREVFSVKREALAKLSREKQRYFDRLAKPRSEDAYFCLDKEHLNELGMVSKKALAYNPTERLKALAKPRKNVSEEFNGGGNHFSVKPTALMELSADKQEFFDRLAKPIRKRITNL